MRFLTASAGKFLRWCYVLPQLGIANLRVRDQLLEIGGQRLATIGKQSNF